MLDSTLHISKHVNFKLQRMPISRLMAPRIDGQGRVTQVTSKVLTDSLDALLCPSQLLKLNTCLINTGIAAFDDLVGIVLVPTRLKR